MKVSHNNLKILEENLVVEIEWLKEEFEILYKSKIENYTEIDKKNANGILDFIVKKTSVYDNLKFHNLLDKVIENIEKMYPALFNSLQKYS